MITGIDIGRHRSRHSEASGRGQSPRPEAPSSRRNGELGVDRDRDGLLPTEHRGRKGTVGTAPFGVPIDSQFDPRVGPRDVYVIAPRGLPWTSDAALGDRDHRLTRGPGALLALVDNPVALAADLLARRHGRTRGEPGNDDRRRW